MTKGEATKASILRQAADMASIHGLEGLSIGRLAERTKLSKSGLFGHFGSKEALKQAVLEHVVEDFRSRVILPALKQPTGVARLDSLFGAWLDWTQAAERRGGCPLLGAAVELDDRPGPLRDYLVARQQSWLEAIARMADKAVAEGEFRAGLDTAQLAFEVNSLGLGFSFAHRLLADPHARRRAQTAFERLLRNARSA